MYIASYIKFQLILCYTELLQYDTHSLLYLHKQWIGWIGCMHWIASMQWLDYLYTTGHLNMINDHNRLFINGSHKSHFQMYRKEQGYFTLRNAVYANKCTEFWTIAVSTSLSQTPWKFRNKHQDMFLVILPKINRLGKELDRANAFLA